jgi:glycosyltransferase involved in cell wall biosynthesis
VGVDLKLIIPERAKRPNYRDKTIHGWYGFEREIPSESLSCTDYISGLSAIWPTLAQRLAFQLMVGTFNRSLIRFLTKQKGEYLLYSRDIHVFSKLIKPFPSVKKIIELHLLEEEPGKTFETENRVFKECSGIVVVTTQMKEMLVERGIAVNKILVESNGVDVKVFPGTATMEEARAKLNLPRKGRIVAYIGNFHTMGLEKGLDTMVQAIPAVIKEFPDTVFFFVGGPISCTKSYIAILESLKVPKRHYQFIDRRPYDEIHLWLAASDILSMLLPFHPRYDKITSPLKVLEYMTAGRPIVVSDLPALREVLVYEKSALFVPPSNAEAFSKAVIRLFDDPALAERLAKQAREDVQHRTWDARAKRIKDWIETLN